MTRFKELHELTDKDRKEIYKSAMKRSKEILNGKDTCSFCKTLLTIVYDSKCTGYHYCSGCGMVY